LPDFLCRCERLFAGEITAKDFRTWAGTVLAAMALAEFERFESEGRRSATFARQSS
jgi:DNA topoisomerase IB